MEWAYSRNQGIILVNRAERKEKREKEKDRKPDWQKPIVHKKFQDEDKPGQEGVIMHEELRNAVKTPNSLASDGVAVEFFSLVGIIKGVLYLEISITSPQSRQRQTFHYRLETNTLPQY